MDIQYISNGGYKERTIFKDMHLFKKLN